MLSACYDHQRHQWVEEDFFMMNALATAAIYGHQMIPGYPGQYSNFCGIKIFGIWEINPPIYLIFMFLFYN